MERARDEYRTLGSDADGSPELAKGPCLRRKALIPAARRHDAGFTCSNYRCIPGTDVSYGSFAAGSLRASADQCPVRPESDGQPPQGNPPLWVTADISQPRTEAFTTDGVASIAKPPRFSLACEAHLRDHAPRYAAIKSHSRLTSLLISARRTVRTTCRARPKSSGRSSISLAIEKAKDHCSFAETVLGFLSFLAPEHIPRSRRSSSASAKRPVFFISAARPLMVPLTTKLSPDLRPIAIASL